MIDVLYLVGPPEADGRGYQELRWSLRSLAKYARNVGRVIVAGYPPDFLSDRVERFPNRNNGERHKFLCQWRKLFAAIDAGVVKGEFLLAYDDNFYARPFDADATPRYYRMEALPPLERENRGGENYRRVLAATRATLLDAGYGIVDAASHCNLRLDTADADEVRRLACTTKHKDAWELGLDIGVMFYNVRMRRAPFKGVYRPDRKIFRLTDADIADGQFSSDAQTFNDPRFVSWMNREFGTPCIYEKPLLPPWSVCGDVA